MWEEERPFEKGVSVGCGTDFWVAGLLLYIGIQLFSQLVWVMTASMVMALCS
jgi:hypothetical protein